MRLPAKPKGQPTHKAPPARLAYSYEETQFLLAGISYATLKRLIDTGKLKPIGGRKMIAHSEIERYLKSETKKQDGRRGPYKGQSSDE